jgi:hypothetical protein
LVLWKFDSLTVFKSVEICRTLYESPLVSKFVEICRFPVSSGPLLCQCWLYYLKEDCKLRLIYLGLLFIVVHQLLAREATFWILIGRSLLILDWKLAFSGIFLGLVGIFFGGLEYVKCLSKNEIRSRHLLGDVSFGFVHWCSAYIRHICYVIPLLPIY